MEKKDNIVNGSSKLKYLWFISERIDAWIDLKKTNHVTCYSTVLKISTMSTKDHSPSR